MFLGSKATTARVKTAKASSRASKPLEMLEFVERQDSSKPMSPNSISVTVNQALYKSIAELATNILAKYDKPSAAFKAYDSRQ